MLLIPIRVDIYSAYQFTGLLVHIARARVCVYI
jgi:hypothetical protein